MANVHIGNVVEFNQPSLPANLDADFRRDRLTGCDEYASMAPFYTDDPGTVLVPASDQRDLDRWAELQCHILRWGSFQPVAWSGDSATLSASLLDCVAIRSDLTAGNAFVPWGETPAFRAFAGQADASVTLSHDPSIAGRVESKLHQAAIFQAAFDQIGQPARLSLPVQTVPPDEDALVAALVVYGVAGCPVVVKSPSGVGGNGSVVLQPHQTATDGRCRRALKAAREHDAFLSASPLIVQRFYWKRSGFGDLTSDYEIDDKGTIHQRGSARMLLEGTHYVGTATIEENSPVVALAERFGLAVGERLAADGYRGWFDVDFVRSTSAGLVPVEINARRTGPTIAFSIRSRLEALRGRGVEVATHDSAPLPKRMAPTSAVDHLNKVIAAQGLAGEVVPTLTTATDSLSPYIGFAVAGSSTQEALSRLQGLRDAVLV